MRALVKSRDGLTMVPRYTEYLGMSKEQASREAEKIILSYEGNWLDISDRLANLKAIYER